MQHYYYQNTFIKFILEIIEEGVILLFIDCNKLGKEPYKDFRANYKANYNNYRGIGRSISSLLLNYFNIIYNKLTLSRLNKPLL